MFNKQPFNKGKFNSTTEDAFSFFAEGIISFGAKAELTTVKTMQANSNIQTITQGNLIKSRKFKGNSEIETSTNCIQLQRVRKFEGNSIIETNAQSTGFNSYGYEFITLTGLTLRQGDELIIDTGEMTVELNGQNVINYLTIDSEFFSIKPGENIIIFENGIVNSKADIKILWKDAFL